MIKIPEHVRKLQAYQTAKSIRELTHEKKLNRIVRLASNENPHGPSPKAVAALRQLGADLHRYVDPRSTELVKAIAERYGRSPSQVMCAHGSDALLAYVINAFTLEGDEILTVDATFTGIFVNTNKQGRKVRLVPLTDYVIDLEVLAASVSTDTKIVYLANPNNPTGTMFSQSRFEAFMDQVPKEVLVILDEAYCAYASKHDGYPDGLQYSHENLIIARSLSKVYGLAGLRIGFAVGPEYLIDALYKVKLPFEPNQPAQVAAMAALADDEFLQRTIEVNEQSLARFTTCFDRLEIPYVKTVACFVLVLLPTEEVARLFFERCLDYGLIVRHAGSFGVANGIRISSGNKEDTEFAVDVIEKVWQEITASSCVTGCNK
ncbi:MAG: histidinol-phosphate transaminase [candidate division Zixibacteria bacterium]|nr:histidinol-phosphate transaminase [candidate division Zixibacteria bacterium]